MKKEDPEREERIEMNALVDTYSVYEAVAGWYAYLENDLEFPFLIEGKNSLVQTVTGLCDSEEFDGDFYVWVKEGSDRLMLRLSDLKIAEASSESIQVIEDWQYFCDRGANHALVESDEEEWY